MSSYYYFVKDFRQTGALDKLQSICWRTAHSLPLEFTGSCCLEQMKFSRFGDSYSVHQGIELHIWDTKVTAYCVRKMQK